jgi:hypothetical protein
MFCASTIRTLIRQVLLREYMELHTTYPGHLTTVRTYTLITLHLTTVFFQKRKGRDELVEEKASEHLSR